MVYSVKHLLKIQIDTQNLIMIINVLIYFVHNIY